MKVLTRRKVIAGLATGLGVGVGGRFLWDRLEGFKRANVFIGKAERYDDGLADLMSRGLDALGLAKDWAKDKTVLLKPNLVEPDVTAPHINTNPVMIRAAAEMFRRRGAKEVIVAEAQGHIRDSHLVLDRAGFTPMLGEMKLHFIDLNHDELVDVKNTGGQTKLKQLVLPATLQRADIVVSMPKMKTHHWAGVTLSMKNLFGVMPGVIYGWPKNVLHLEGIPSSIVDITSTVAPELAIIDGIVGMDGDGPIMGNPKTSNLIVMGTNLVATDATAARLMGFDPQDIPYLRMASALGPILDNHIEQRGETIASLEQRYALLDDPRLKEFRKQ